MSEEKEQKNKAETANNSTPETAFTEPDYYFNPEGLLTFTATFLKNRGQCCKNGCLNCPYPLD